MFPQIIEDLILTYKILLVDIINKITFPRYGKLKKMVYLIQIEIEFKCVSSALLHVKFSHGIYSFEILEVSGLLALCCHN